MNSPPQHEAYAFKKSIFRYLLAGMLLLAVFFLFSVLWSYQRQDEIRHTNWEENVERVFKQRMWGVSKNIEAILYVLGKNPVLQQQFLDRDRAALLKTAQELEQHFAQDQQITHFYFHDIDKVNFLRVHQPERYGDTIDRITMQQAMDTGKMASGVELGPLGTLTMRLVLPWYAGDKLIGYLELGRELSSMISVLKSLNLVEGCLLTVKKEYIDRQGWEQGMAMLQRDADWSFFPDKVVMWNILPKEIDITVDAHYGSRGVLDLFYQTSTGSYMSSFLPLLDAANREVGQLIYLRDELAPLQIARQQIRFFLLSLAALTLLLLFLFYRVLSKVEARLMESGKELEQRVNDRTRELQDEVSLHQKTSHQLEQERQLQESLVLSRTRVLDAVAYSARSFLNQGDWQKQLPSVLERLGQAVDASRVTFYQNSWTEDGDVRSSLIEVWPANSLPNPKDDSQLQNLSAHKVGFERWKESLKNGKPIHGPVLTFPESEQEFLQSLNIQSILVEPFFVEKEWWGFLVFTDCVAPRQWSKAEVNGLYTVAEALGATIQRQQQEESLRAAKQAAVTANKAKSDFLANMSHEIRTPMNAIVGFVDLSLQEKVSAKVRRNLNIVKTSSINLLGILNDILDFSKIESKKIIIETVEFNLVDITSNLKDMLSEKAAERGNQLVFNIDKDVPDALIGDPLRLGQILVNLLGNGIKFTRDGIVSVDIVCRDSVEDMVDIRFSVRDSGVGIAADKLEHIFDNFTQADGSTTREFGGTGLGLTISRKLTLLMDGELEVTSTLGKGSAFSLILPLGVQSVQPQPKPQETDNNQGKKILVVDDDDKIAELLEIMLGYLGFEVETAGRSTVAMEKLRNAAEQDAGFDLVLMDFMMPEQDGVATSKEIKNDPLLADTHIIMLTAFGAGLEQQMVKEASLDGFLMKPIVKDVLLENIKRVLQIEEDGDDEVEVKQKVTENKLFKDYSVLLVEDNAFNQILAKEVLQNAGLRVETADNGKEALEVLLNLDKPLNAILMDVQMPVLDGLLATTLIRQCETGNLPETGEHQELLTKLSAKIHGTHISIVAMTAKAMTGDRENCLQAGMDEYIAKPFMQEAVLQTLQRVADAG